MSARWVTTERKLLGSFLQIIIDADTDKVIQDIVWEEYTTPIRLLFDNRFLSQQYWDFQNNLIPEDR